MAKIPEVLGQGKRTLSMLMMIQLKK